MPDPTSKEIVSDEDANRIREHSASAQSMREVALCESIVQLIHDRSARIASEASKDAEIERLREARRWRKVGEEKPRDEVIVLVCLKQTNGRVTEAQMKNRSWWDHDNWHGPIDATPDDYWMPLPDPPQEAKP